MGWQNTLWREPASLTDEEIIEICLAGRAHRGPEGWLAEVAAEADRRDTVCF